MKIEIPSTSKKRIVIVGGGFAGLNLVEKLDNRYYQVVLIDRNNYHQFPPLLYQVASSGLEADSICFPFRKLFHREKDFFFRMADVLSIDTEGNRIRTSIGSLGYDYLILCGGTATNYYGNQTIAKSALSMKNIHEALYLRNSLLLNIERALDEEDPLKRRSLLNIVIVGGGATGVEIAGALAEMKRFIVPRDYPDLNDKLQVYLVEGADRVLGVMSSYASKKALQDLQKMEVEVLLKKRVTDYKNGEVILDGGQSIPTCNLIWVSGVIAFAFEGIRPDQTGRGGRILVDRYNRVKDAQNIFAVGDCCLMTEEKYPNGHPQVAQAAIQQGRFLAKNLNNIAKGKPTKPFHYRDLGTMATIGRNKAVADFKGMHLHGFFAWAIWLTIHLRSILGVKNKLIVLINWVWNYIMYDQSARFIFMDTNKDKDSSKTPFQ